MFVGLLHLDLRNLVAPNLILVDLKQVVVVAQLLIVVDQRLDLLQLVKLSR